MDGAREAEDAGLPPLGGRHRPALRRERPLRAPGRDPLEGLHGARHRDLRPGHPECDHRRDHHQGPRPRHQGPPRHPGQPGWSQPAAEGALRRRRLPLRRAQAAGRPRARRRPGRPDPGQEHPPVPQGHRRPPRSLRHRLGHRAAHLPAGQGEPEVVDTALPRALHQRRVRPGRLPQVPP